LDRRSLDLLEGAVSRSLDPEIEFFEENLDVLRAEAEAQGKRAVLIHDGNVVGYFNSVVEAGREGYRRFGSDLFLARSIEADRQQLLIASIYA